MDLDLRCSMISMYFHFPLDVHWMFVGFSFDSIPFSSSMFVEFSLVLLFSIFVHVFNGVPYFFVGFVLFAGFVWDVH